MSEPDVQAELETLRQTNKELLAKAHERKTKIEELEAQVVTLRRERDDAHTEVQTALVDIPMRKIAEEITNAPALFLQELSKRYKVVPNGDKLELQTPDGKTVMDGKEPWPVTANGLWRLTTGYPHYAKTDEQKMWATLLRWMGPRGGNAGNTRPGHSAADPEIKQKESAPKLELGLR